MSSWPALTAAAWAQVKLATRTAALPTPWVTREQQTEAMEGVRVVM